MPMGHFCIGRAFSHSWICLLLYFRPVSKASPPCYRKLMPPAPSLSVISICQHTQHKCNENSENSAFSQEAVLLLIFLMPPNHAMAVNKSR